MILFYVLLVDGYRSTLGFLAEFPFFWNQSFVSVFNVQHSLFIIVDQRNEQAYVTV
jgi:hypothetical protein